MPDASHGCADSFRDPWAFRLGSVRDGDAHVIALAGELDDWTIEAVERELKRVERTDARFIVLDLRGLEFIACSGLRVIVMAHRRQAGRLIVVKGPQHVQRVFEICNLVKVLPLVEKFPDDVAVTRRARNVSRPAVTQGVTRQVR
jgi:anti-sigma B factor antagonist